MGWASNSSSASLEALIEENTHLFKIIYGATRAQAFVSKGSKIDPPPLLLTEGFDVTFSLYKTMVNTKQ